MEKAHDLSEKWGKVPVTIAGDFNSTPGVCVKISCLLFISKFSEDGNRKCMLASIFYYFSSHWRVDYLAFQ